MCGCTGDKNGLVNSTACQGRVSDLHKVRNRLITIEKLAKTPEKKEEYKEVRGQVEELLKDSVGSCPSLEIISGLKDYVDNEYTIYNN